MESQAMSGNVWILNILLSATAYLKIFVFFYLPRKIKTSDGHLDGTTFWNLCLIPTFSGLGKNTELIHFMLWAYSMFCPFEYLLHSLLLSSSPEVWAFELDRLVFSPGLVTLSQARSPNYSESHFFIWKYLPHETVPGD